MTQIYLWGGRAGRNPCHWEKAVRFDVKAESVKVSRKRGEQKETFFGHKGGGRT